MFNKPVLNLFTVVFLMFFNNAYAEQKPVEQLKSFLASTKYFTADFKQVTINEKGNPAQQSEGVFYLSRPGKFRWQYKKPYEQEIVSTEGKVWFYDVDLEQVTIKKIDDSLGSTPALLLSGAIQLEENFTLKKQGVDEGLQWIKLSPKNEESGYNSILIGLEKGVLGGMELSDNFGQLTRIYFSNVKVNNQLDESVFTLNVPKGVDVFEN
jgi:outer membrane lipoprotein carrier protein